MISGVLRSGGDTYICSLFAACSGLFFALKNLCKIRLIMLADMAAPHEMTLRFLREFRSRVDLKPDFCKDHRSDYLPDLFFWSAISLRCPMMLMAAKMIALKPRVRIAITPATEAGLATIAMKPPGKKKIKKTIRKVCISASSLAGRNIISSVPTLQARS